MSGISMRPRPLPRIETPRLILRLARREDAVEVADCWARNRAFHKPTEPRRPEEFYTEPFWRDQAERSVQEFHRDQSVRLFLFEKSGKPEKATSRPRVLGSASFNQICRGPFQACTLGYALDEKEQGKGLMSEALEAAIRYAFMELNLHRIMAGYMPHNARSAAVLRRLGFEIEGQARDYILIDGQWRDHVLTSRVNPAWRSAQV